MEDLSYIDPNSPTLRQSLADVLRGLTKKEDLQQVNQAIKNTTQLVPSILESLGRGAVSQVPGMVGDISFTARQFVPESMQNVFGNRQAPTTEEILQVLPRLNPDYQGSSQHEIIGSFTAPALAKMLKMGVEAGQGLKGGLIIEDVSKINGFNNSESIRNSSEDFFNKVKELGYEAKIQHSGSAAGPSSYVQLNEFKDPFRFSNHSKGVFNNQFVKNIFDENHKEKILKELEILAPKFLEEKQYNNLRQIKDNQETQVLKKLENPSKFEKELDDKAAHETRKQLLEKNFK